MKKGASLFLAAAMTAGLLTGCGSSSTDSSSSDLEGTITAAGSSALKPLVDEASQKFIEKNPNVSITVDAGGSGEGLKQVSEGTVTIGNSDVSAEEKLDADQAKELVDHQVCVVTMAPIVNKDVTEAGVKDLSTDQLIGIFTGQITNWKDVGGPDEDIVLVTRPSSSGTRATFEKYALNGNAEAENKSMETDDSGVLLKNVSDTKGAIGYVALSYLVDNKDVDAVSIDGVAPTLEIHITEHTKYGQWNICIQKVKVLKLIKHSLNISCQMTSLRLVKNLDMAFHLKWKAQNINVS